MHGVLVKVKLKQNGPLWEAVTDPFAVKSYGIHEAEAFSNAKDALEAYLKQKPYPNVEMYPKVPEH